MDQRRNEPEFDEFEKLLGEIPKVTSGNDIRLPIRLNSRRSSQFEEAKLPDDCTFTEPSLNFGNPMQKPFDNSHLMYFPSYHGDTSPCVYDKFDSRKLDSQVFRRCLPNFSGLQGVQFCPNLEVPGLDLPAMSDQPHYLPSSHSMSHYPPLGQSHINWRNIEERQRLKLQEEQYLSTMNPHFLYMNPRQDLQHCNRNLFSNDDHESLDAVRKMWYPENMLMRSQSSPKVLNYGIGDESHDNTFKQKGRLWLHNQYDDSSSWDLCDMISLENLTLQPQKYNSLAEARGKMYYMAKDQHGCRFLQRKFAERDSNDIEMIFCEIIDYITELMIDPFGNYLVQKLLEVCNDDQRMQILHSITRNPGMLVKISCDMHGTRAVQKIVETVKTQDEISIIISALKPGIVTLIKNVNGNHVAQRCLQYLLPHCGKFLFEAVITHCVELATDRHGCCVLQKCLGFSEGEQRHCLVSEIASNALLLSQDPFGNYVLQYVFELQLPWAITAILEQLEGKYTELSMQKCSSNVVEKCLKLADDKHRSRIIKELVSYGHLDQVMLDPYGNYVIQAALKQSKGTLHALLVDSIKVHLPSLRINPYGKKVLSALSLKK